jgi:hypothetical protein
MIDSSLGGGVGVGVGVESANWARDVAGQRPRPAIIARERARIHGRRSRFAIRLCNNPTSFFEARAAVRQTTG